MLVGYRGVDGSVRLDCPEVSSAMEDSGDLLSEQSYRAVAAAYRSCADRLRSDGVDLAGYSIPEEVDDLEAARRALGYHQIDLVSESAGTRIAMIYAWRYPKSIHRSVMIGVVLNCPEVTAALENSADFLGKASLSAYSQAFASCAQRLERSGVDLAGYTLAEQADDIEAARVALGYKRIDLLSESAGTRLAMIYAWRYPNSVDRSVMIGVNPPGNFLYSGAEIDQGIERYSALCAQQPACRARTGNLAASMQHTAAHMPSSWYSLPIKPGNVLVGTFLGLTEATSVASPLSGPMTLDSWISAAHGDPSGLWLLSTMAGLILPQSFVWGEFASIGMADAQPVERYFSSGADRGSIIGNPLAEFLWGAGGLAHAWPANPGENQYTSVQNSNVPTLLIGGTLDFETPAQNATKELLPHLPNGHQVILSGLGHADDF